MFNINRFWPVKIHVLLAGLFYIVFAAMLFLQATEPIYDPDFWWHLKAGETMLQEGGLLQSDPFTLQESSEPTTREKIILRGYWLWQITAYTLYDLFSFNGIHLLKLLSLAAVALALILQLYRRRVGPGLAALLLFAGFLILERYPVERPQFFSFFFAILLVGMLMAVRRGGRLGPALPILMCLWANIHGGFVAGVLILLCFALGVVIEYRHNLPKMKILLVWVVGGIVASLLNPNGGLVFTELINFHGSNLMNMTAEWRSTWAAFNQGEHFHALAWLLVSLYFGAVFVLRRLFWPEFLVALFLAYFSLRYLRNVPFFTLAMLPVIGGALSEVAHRWRSPGLRWTGMVATSAAILMSLWVVQASWRDWQPHVKVSGVYPEQSIDFLERSGLQGRMFNSYEYGGYLLWRLGPAIKVFIDSRGMDPHVYDDYFKIVEANVDLNDARNDSLMLLNGYQIDYVIQPIYDGLGRVQPLMKSLLDRSEWLPIYLDKHVYILAKEGKQNPAIIEAHQIDKSEFKKRLLLIYNYLSWNDPQQIGYRIALAGMYIYLGKHVEARKEVNAIAAISPDDIALPSLLLDLQALEWRKSRSRD